MMNDDPAARLDAVRAELARAATTAQRDPADVTLIAVSKTQPAAAIAPLIAAGQRDFGENRIQELLSKWPELRAATPDVRLHFIGQLQSNKAAEAVAACDAIHSLDRATLIAALARAIDAAGRSPRLFVQVNIGDEPQKGGVPISGLTAFLMECRAAGLILSGLMAIPPVGREPAPYFALLAKLACAEGLAGLSIGMSADATTAVTLGATHVRVGTALFGARQ